MAEQYYDDIYRFCLYLTGHEADSYDLTQEVFLRFLKYSTLGEHKNLKGYLLIIARNLCRDYLRHRHDMVQLDQVPELESDSRPIVNLEDRILIKTMLQDIPEEQREVIVLRIHQDLKFREIAKILDCNLSTVKSRYRLGIKNMRQIMGDSV